MPRPVLVAICAIQHAVEDWNGPSKLQYKGQGGCAELQIQTPKKSGKTPVIPSVSSWAAQTSSSV